MDNRFLGLSKASMLSLLALIACSSVHAAPITLGELSYDSAVDPTVIVDSSQLANGQLRHWLRWDHATTKSQYPGTPNATIDGWHFANYLDAQRFVNLLKPADIQPGQDASCPAIGNEGCWSDNNRVGGVYSNFLGDNVSSGYSLDAVLFLSDQPSYTGILKVSDSGRLVNVEKHSSFWNIATANRDLSSSNLGWLMFKDIPQPVNSVSKSVSEPATLGLMALSFCALGALRRKKS